MTRRFGFNSSCMTPVNMSYKRHLTCGLMAVVFSICLLMAPVVYSDGAATGPSQAPVDDPAPSAPATNQTEPPVYGIVREALMKLAAEDLLAPESPEIADEILTALTSAFKANVQYFPPDTAKGQTGKNSVPNGETDQDAQTTLQIAAESIIYCRVPFFDKSQNDTFSQLIKDLNKGAYKGIICDLRYASGTAYKAATKMARTISQHDVTMIILVNRNTSGAAETFAHRLLSRQKTIIIGQPTNGMPLRSKKIELSNGGVLSVPDRDTPGAQGIWPPAPIEPDITEKSHLTRTDLAELTGREFDVVRLGRDRALRRALDLLTVVKGLANKHF